MAGLKVDCANETETGRLAETVSMALKSGDLITLTGALGAGKTTFVRALIRSASNDPYHEVPSPTFTLMQVYEELHFGKLAHLDLYRIEHPDELDELGLDEILHEGVGFVEWPEKAGGELPPVTLSIVINHVDETSREFCFEGEESTLHRLKRSFDVRDFLNAEGHEKCNRLHLTGDASSRSYETIQNPGHNNVILMNAPSQPDGPPIKNGLPYSRIAHLAEDMTAFAAIAHALEQNGFRVPKIEAMDLDKGLLLIEDLGTGSIITSERAPIEDRYRASVEMLADMHKVCWESQIVLPNGAQHIVPPFDRAAIQIEVELLSEWYVPYALGRSLTDIQKSQFEAIWDDLIDKLEQAEKSLLLRDYHSPNIIWMDDAAGIDRIGLIDFQDALIGPTAYDVASLAQDARIDVPAHLETQLVDHYCKQRGDFDESGFRKSYAIMAAERATKVLGIFVRLSKRDGKHGYLQHLQRIETYLKRSLAHPVLADYRRWLKDVLNFDIE